MFTHNADAELLSQYSIPPAVVPKPDLVALEELLLRLGRDEQHHAVEQDRRARPARAAEGPAPTGISDAQAFFVAINGAIEGDALVSLDVPVGGEAVADEVGRRLRDSDRVLIMPPRAVRVFLPGGGEEGVASVLARIRGDPGGHQRLPGRVGDRATGEHGADAFERLKNEGELHPSEGYASRR